MFYKRIRSYLEDRGFLVNPHDTCVPNKMVYWAQMAVCWHVDDLKIFHRDKEMVTAFAVNMANIYRANTTISRGGVNDYLRCLCSTFAYLRRSMVC